MNKTAIYTVGGTVQAGSGIYIKRKADDELLELCRSGELAFILSSRQVGKSSLMIRTAQQLEEEGIRSATIDLSAIGVKVTQDEWYLGILNEITTGLNLETDIFTWWNQYEGLGAAQRFFNFLRDILLKEIKDNIVLFFDEIDSTLSIAFSDDFFATLRATYNARSTAPDFQRLSFVLVGVATPGDLISDSKRTPFNIGYRVDLNDFTLEEAAPLAQGLGESAEQVLARVLDWSGGHPYLTQRLCAYLSKKGGVLNEEKIGQAVEDLFLSEQGQQDNNLQFVRDMLVKRSPDTRRVMTTFMEIRSGKKVADDERSIIKAHLKITGVVKRQSGRLVTRNRIYERVFEPKWIKENTPSAVPRRLVIGSAVTVVLALLIAAFFAYRDWARTDAERAAQFTSDFQIAKDSRQRLENLAGLFELEGYGDDARALFDQLTQDDKLQLFSPANTRSDPDEQVIVVMGEYRYMLNTPDDNALLQTMKDAVKGAEEPPYLYDEITAWLKGREELNREQFYSAEAYFYLAIDKNPDNPAVYYDLADAQIRMAKHSDALDSLVKMIQLDQSRGPDAYRLIASNQSFASYWEAQQAQEQYTELSDSIAGRAVGVSVSYWDAEIDWGKVKDAGIDFAFTKATEGDFYSDPTFEENWLGAKSAGIPRGAWHFFRANVDPAQQAEAFIQLVQATGDDGELPPVLDLETNDGQPASHVSANAKVWLDLVGEAFGKKPIIYSSYYFIRDYLSEPGDNPLGWVSEYPLWMAQYPYTYNDSLQPPLPEGWPSWIFWEYTELGKVNGINANVTVSVFNGTTAELQQLLTDSSIFPISTPSLIP